MSLCVIDHGHCCCQPDEGIFCPAMTKPDGYVQALHATIIVLRARLGLAVGDAEVTDTASWDAAIDTCI